MTLPIRRKTREEARTFSLDLKRLAASCGRKLEDFTLLLGRPNDIHPGSGPRFAIVEIAQSRASEGATYGEVMNLWVHGGNGRAHKIVTNDLAGFVCANGHCHAVAPGGVAPVGSKIWAAVRVSVIEP